ncbi:MAG: alpha/beta fold hydrolase, partial [bacterium]
MLKRAIILGLVGSLFWLTPAFAKNPVLLVHGTNDTSEMWETGCLKKTLQNAGFDVFTLADFPELGGDFPLKGQGLIQEDIKQLKKIIDKIKEQTDAEKVDIIAHSRGGLVAELYTMMYGNQHESEMKYTYLPANSDKPKEITITGIPRYGNDVGQIIMLGTPNKGSFLGEWAYHCPEWLKKLIENTLLPNPYFPAVEQQQTKGSNFMEELFWENNLNSNVNYFHIAEDRIFGGDLVVSYDSAKGVLKHALDSVIKKVSSLGIPLPVWHLDLPKNIGIKKEILEETFSQSPITAKFSISPESPVREGAISISITLSESLPSAPTLFIKGNGAFSSPHPISLAGSGKNFSVILNIPKGTDGSAKLYFEDKTQMQVKIASADCNEDIIETIDVPISGYQFFLIDTEEPEVTATTPADGEVIIAEEIPYTVNISATLFDPPINGYASGIDNSTIVLNTPQGTFHQASAVNKLDYGEYTWSIEAKDNANTPGHDLKQSPYRRSFEIVPPIFVSIHPAWQNFTEPYESHTHYITITNKAKNKSFTANIEMKLIKESGCLSITQYPADTLDLPADSQASTSFVVTSGEELIPDDNLIHQITVSVPGLKLSAIQYANGQNIVTDHPDESYDISDPRYPTPAKIDSEAEVGVYLNGFVDGVAHLLGRFKEPVWFIDRDFEPLPTEIKEKGRKKEMEKNIKRILSFSPYSPSLLTKNERLKPELQRKLQDFKVLVIPSYGLSGVDTSEILEWRLRKYVEEGGVVVCFTQKYGYEFEFLPGTVTGYGANEDQSCWKNAGYIDEYHPIMAGQDSANLDANADGYFTQWGDAKIILRRVKNQQPMLIMYKYGKGYVVACTLYTDWGYGHSHWSTDETNLIRDLITWAKFREQGLGMRDEMPETKPGGTITVKCKIKNEKLKSAAKVVVKVIDPDKKPLPPYTLDLTPGLLPNQTMELSLPSSLIPP